ncbi:MAG: DsrE/DsrF-like family protein [Cyanobacteria bacterium RI_101]|nr:DsrE/DsrF-like family protein [Cyanobacteria bacterium RI_101]
MKTIAFVTSLWLAAVPLSLPVLAGNDDPLFINLTTNEAHRSKMAIGFSQAQLERGHPLTIFLNDRGILLAAKANAGQYREQQAILRAIIEKGGVVLACPTCMKQYGVSESDLLEGVKVGNPALTGEALFRDDTQTLSW